MFEGCGSAGKPFGERALRAQARLGLGGRSEHQSGSQPGRPVEWPWAGVGFWHQTFFLSKRKTRWAWRWEKQHREHEERWHVWRSSHREEIPLGQIEKSRETNKRMEMFLESPEHPLPPYRGYKSLLHFLRAYNNKIQEGDLQTLTAMDSKVSWRQDLGRKQ
jgi:hypothetical protein